MKIHGQFGHASSDNIANLLDNDILPLIDKVYDTCKTCKQYEKLSSSSCGFKQVILTILQL